MLLLDLAVLSLLSLSFTLSALNGRRLIPASQTSDEVFASAGFSQWKKWMGDCVEGGRSRVWKAFTSGLWKLNFILQEAGALGQISDAISPKTV